MRRFRVDASKKVYASPIDFELMEGMDNSSRNKITAEKVCAVLDQHKEELINYIDTKITTDVVDRLNEDIAKLRSKYPGCGRYIDKSKLPHYYNPSTVEGLHFGTDDEGDIYLTPSSGSLEEDFCERVSHDWSDAYVYFNVETNETEVWGVDPSDVYEAWKYLFSQPEIYQKLELDSLVSTFENLVYSFAEVIDEVVSEAITNAMKKYFDERE